MTTLDQSVPTPSPFTQNTNPTNPTNPLQPETNDNYMNPTPLRVEIDNSTKDVIGDHMINELDVEDMNNMDENNVNASEYSYHHLAASNTSWTEYAAISGGSIAASGLLMTVYGFNWWLVVNIFCQLSMVTYLDISTTVEYKVKRINTLNITPLSCIIVSNIGAILLVCFAMSTLTLFFTDESQCQSHSEPGFKWWMVMLSVWHLVAYEIVSNRKKNKKNIKIDTETNMKKNE